MFIELIKITHILPCLADSEKTRFIACFEKNVSELLRLLKASVYNVPGVFVSDKNERRS